MTQLYRSYKKGLFSKLASMEEEEQLHEGNTQKREENKA
jgi:hypothetical protein